MDIRSIDRIVGWVRDAQGVHLLSGHYYEGSFS